MERQVSQWEQVVITDDKVLDEEACLLSYYSIHIVYNGEEIWMDYSTNSFQRTSPRPSSGNLDFSCKGQDASFD